MVNTLAVLERTLFISLSAPTSSPSSSPHPFLPVSALLLLPPSPLLLFPSPSSSSSPLALLSLTFEVLFYRILNIFENIFISQVILWNDSPHQRSLKLCMCTCVCMRVHVCVQVCACVCTFGFLQMFQLFNNYRVRWSRRRQTGVYAPLCFQDEPQGTRDTDARTRHSSFHRDLGSCLWAR